MTNRKLLDCGYTNPDESNQNTPIYLRVEALAEQYDLSETVKKQIMQLVKDSYIQGSNDNFKAMKK